MALLLAALLHPAAASADGTSLFPGVSCVGQTIPVAVSPGAATTAVLTGELCATPAELVPGAPVHLALPGATYNHAYWNWPTDGYLHSYARALALAGWPVLALDRLGSGGSTRLLSTQQMLNVDAFTVHQVIHDLIDRLARLFRRPGTEVLASSTSRGGRG